MSHLLFWPTITFFYPVGNTSAVCLTENLSPESKADILLLACGDPRHILYTIYANETSSSSHSRRIDITCCDVDVAILARNTLLFTLLADDGILKNLDDVWNLFYHTFVSQSTLSMLFDQCRKLISLAENTETWRAGPYGHFLTTCDTSTLAGLRRVWAAYLSTASFSSKQAKRFEQQFTDGMKVMSQRSGSGGTTSAARSAGPLGLHAQKSVSRQFGNYWTSGITENGMHVKMQSKKRRLAINPMFTFSIDGDKFAVHYGTDPLCGFHLAEAFASEKFTRPHESIPSHEVVRVAKEQFSRWCTSMSSRLKAINPSSSTFVIRMYAGDALSFCHALKYCKVTQSPVTPYDVAAWRLSTVSLDNHYYGCSAVCPAPLSFNVIDTSNILDHVGLVNLLVVTAPLLYKTPLATLYTEALLRTGDNPSQGILEHVCGDLATMALLLGVVPLTFISQFSTRSNVHETLTMSDGRKQYHERLAWKHVGLDVNSTSPQRLCFSPEELSGFLFRVYLSMFSNEDVSSKLQLLSLSPAHMVHTIRQSGVLHYNRRSFALLVHFIKSRVQTDWQHAMDLFEDLVLADARLMTGLQAYQELCCQLHLLNVYTAPWILHYPSCMYPNGDVHVPKLFQDWTRGSIPRVVTLVLVVPREAIAKLEHEFVNLGTPVLHCFTHDGPRQNWFAVTSATFGTLRVSGTGESRVAVVVEGTDTAANAPAMQPLWRTGAPLITTFSVPSSSVMDFARSPNATIGLAFHPTMVVATKFGDKLGPDLTIFRTRLTDAQHVFVLARRPVVGTGAGFTASHWREGASGLERGTGSQDASHKTSTEVHVRMDSAASAAKSFAVRIDVTDPSAQAALGDMRTIPTVASKTGSLWCLDACVRIGTHTNPVRFPLPVDIARAKLRVARKSSYIEVVAPLASFDVRPERDVSNRFTSLSADLDSDGTPTLGSIHRVNLDRCPAFQLVKNASTGSWYDLHIALMFSDSERQRASCADTTNPGTLVRVKQTLSVLLRSAAGANPDGKTPEDVFALFDTSCQLTYLYIIVARMCLDVGSHTVVADAFVAPNTPAVRAALGIAIHATTVVGARKPQKADDVVVRYLCTDEDETATWFHLLPRLTERCRTWSHKQTCAYRSRTPVDPAGVPLGAWGRRTPLCACGEGIGAEVLPKQFERVAPYLTRAAFSPLFSVPYLKEVDVPICGSAMAMGASECEKHQCRTCGKEGGRVCSRCKGARYCSETCQLVDWKNHKKNCGKGL